MNHKLQPIKQDARITTQPSSCKVQKQNRHNLLNNKVLLTLALILNSLFLFGQDGNKNCDFHIQVTAQMARCYNDGYVTIKAVDGAGNELYIAAHSADANPYNDLSEIKYGYKKISSGADTVHWTNESTIQIDTGTYMITAQALCFDASQPEGSRYSIVEDFDTVTITTSYVKPKVSIIEQMASTSTGYGTVPALVCDGVGRVQFRIYDGAFPYMIRICNADTVPIDTVYYAEHQYEGTNTSRYDYNEYYSIDSLQAGKYFFFVEDGCDYHLPRVSQTITTVQDPSITAVSFYAWSGSYADSNRIRVQATLNLPNAYYNDPENVKYRFIHNDINGVTDTTDWKLLPNWSSYVTGDNNIVLYDTIHNAHGYCDLYGKTITFQALKKGCVETINLTKSHIWNKPTNFYTTQIFVSDSSHLFSAVYDSCGYYTSYDTSYGHYEPVIYFYNDNEYFYKSTDATTSETGNNYQVTYPIYYVYRDTRYNSVIKIDTVRRPSQPTASWSSYSSNGSYPSSVLREADIEPIYGAITEVPLTIPVSRTLYDAFGCEIYTRTDDITYKNTLEVTSASRYNTTWATQTNQTYYDYCCNNKRSVTVYGNYVQVNYGDSTVVELIQSPLNNRYNFKAIYHLATNSWTYEKDSISNLADITFSGGTSVTIADYCLPSGVYKFRVTTPHCGTFTPSKTVTFNDTHTWTADLPTFNTRAECTQMLIKPTGGRYYRNIHNEYKSYRRNGVDYTGVYDSTETATARYRIIKNYRPSGSPTSFSNTYFYNGDSVRVTGEGDYVIEITQSSIDVSSSQCPSPVYYDTVHFDGGTVAFDYVYTYLCDSTDTNGWVRVKGKEGTLPYTYTLYSGPDLSGEVLGQNTTGRFDAVPLSANQVVSVHIKDACDASFQINQPVTVMKGLKKAWFFGESQNMSTCEGTSVDLFSVGLDELVTYHWTGPNGFEANVQNPRMFLPRGSAPGYYKVEIQNTSCEFASVTDSVYIDMIPAPTVKILKDTTVCPGQEVTVEYLPEGEGTVYYTIAYEENSLVHLQDYSGASSMTFEPTSKRTYWVYSVTDDNCNYTIPEDTVVININNHIATSCDVLTTSPEVCHNTNTEVTAHSSLATPYYIRWYKDYEQTQYLRTDTINNPSDYASYLFENVTQDTSIYVTVSNAGYCESKYGTVMNWMNMSSGNKELRCGESIRFYDSGGKLNNYSAFEDATHVFTTLDGQPLTLTFTELNTQTTYDHLLIYTGNTTNPDSLIADLSGNYTGHLPEPIVSNGNSMTVRFLSNGKTEASGWVATVSNNPKPTAADVHVYDELSVASVSADPYVHYDGSVTIDAHAEGGKEEAYLYQWHTSTDGGTSWNFVSSETTSHDASITLHNLTGPTQVKVTVQDASTDPCTGAEDIVKFIPIANIKLSLDIEVADVDVCEQDYPVKVTVHNNGPQTAEQVTALVKLPYNVEFINPADSLLLVGDLAGHDSAVFNFMVRSYVIDNYEQHLPVKAQIWSCVQGDSVPTVEYGDWNWNGAPRQVDEDVDSLVTKPYLLPSDFSIAAIDDTVCYLNTAVLKASSDIAAPQYFKWFGDAALTQLLKTDTVDTEGGYTQYEVDSLTTETTLYITIENDNYCPAVLAGAVNAKFNAASTRTVNMQDGSTPVGINDNISFYDDGGFSGNYLNKKDYTHTFTSTSGAVVLRLNNITLGTGEALTLYDGPTTSSPVLASYTASSTASSVYTANSGALTVRWHSDASGVDAGWSGNVVNSSSYISTEAVARLYSPVNKVNVTTGDDYVCYGDDATLTASTSIDAPQYFTWYDNEFSILKQDTSSTGTSTLNVPNQTRQNTYYVSVSNDLTCPAVVGHNSSQYTTGNTVLMNSANNNKTTKVKYGEPINFYDEGGPSGDYFTHNAVYTHTFSTERGNIKLVFTSFYSESTSYDWMYIYDGPNTSSPMMSDILGGDLTSQMPKTFTSTGNSLTVYWRTDVSVVRAGWAATVEALTPGYDTAYISKDYNVLLDASTNNNTTNVSPDDVFGFYDDGGSTGAYSNNAGVFTHTFKANQGVVQADLSQMYLASGDTLFLYDGTTLTDEHLIAKLSGNITVARQYFSSGDKMTFKFMSHGNTSTTYYGWNMQVTSKWSEALAQANVYLHAPVADASLYGSVEEVCYNDDAVLKAYSDSATVFTWYAPDKATILKRDTVTSSPSTLELSNVRSDAIYYISTNAVGSCPTIPPYQISTELLNIGNNGKSTHLDSYDYINFYDEGGSAANYYSNTYNYAHTYTTDEGQMHIRFNSLTLAALDTLCLYSGTTANSDSLIVALTNANNTSTAVNYHSTGNKLTVMFKKKSTTTAAGWSAAVTNHSTLSQTVILNALTDNKTTYVSPIDNIQFYDDGGLSNNYNLTNKTQTHTFTAMQGKVKVKFGTTGNQLNTNDNLIVIDGDADGTILATLSGAASNFNSKEFVSSGNQLTFQFVTFGKGVSSGWNVEVTALNDLPLAEAKVSIKAPSSKTNLTSTDDFVCYGETAVLTAKAPSLAYPQIYTWYTPTLSTVARDTVETVGGSELVLPNQTQDEYYLVSVQNGDVCPTMFPIGHTVVKTNPSTPTASTYVAENDIINFYDDGGPSANYSNGQNDYIQTFTTAAGKQIYVNFTQHTLATGDTLYIYDGATADNANLIERFSYYNNGTTGSYQSTSSALTFKFAKHSSTNAAGWNASIATWQQTAKEIKLNAETDQQMSIVTPADSIMFYDDGYTSNYVREKDTLVHTFKAFQGNVELKFNGMSLGSGDYLYLYSGDEVNAAHRIASLTSSTSTYSDTSITVQFIKKGNYAGTGWVAKVVSKVVPVMDTAYVSIHRPLTGAVVSATNDTLCYGETAALTANSSIKYPQYYTWWNDDLSAVLKQDTVSSGNISHFNPENQISDSIYYVTIHNDTTCPYDPTGYPAFKTLKPNLLMNNTSSTAKVLVGNLDSIPFYDHGGINGNTSTTSQYYYLLQADPGQQVILHIDTLNLYNNSTNALKVYDGTSTSAALKADLYGAISDTTIVSTNGSLYLYQKSTSGVMGWIGTITSDYQPFAIAKSEVTIRKPLGSVAVTATNDTVCYDYTADLTASSSLTYPQYYTWWDKDRTTLLGRDTVTSGVSHFNPAHQISDSLYYVHVYDSLNCPYLPEVYNFGENKFLGDFLMTPDKANKVTTLACGDSLNFYDEGGKTGSYTRHNQNYYHTFKAEEGKQVVLKLTSFYSESLSFDWMCIYDGTTPIARYRLDSLGGNLNTSMPKTYVSTTGSLTVRWRTDVSQLYDGWEGTITTDCHGTDLAESHVSIRKPLGAVAVTATNDTVCYDYTADLTATSSLTYPQYYSWWASDGTTLLSTDTINSAADKTHFRPEHQISDSLYYVHVYDSLNCAYIPSLHARILLPEYKMNQTSVDTTFLSCGDSIPFYDHGGKNGNTTTSSTYYRIFKAEPGKQVTIHIDTLSLISNSSYYLKIYDGVTETGTPLANLYGNKANLTYTSTKGALYVRHYSYSGNMGWEGSVTTNCFDLAESHVSIQKPLGSEALTATNDTVCYDYTADLTATSSLTYPQYYTWWASDGTTLLSTDTINSAADKTHFRPEHQISDSLYYVHVYDSLNCAYIPSLHARILLPEYKMNQTSVDTTFLSCGDSIPFYDMAGDLVCETNYDTYKTLFKASPGKQIVLHIDTLSLFNSAIYGLHIYDGPNKDNQLAHLYGSGHHNLTFISTNGSLYVEHVNVNAHLPNMGWEGSVVVSCNTVDLAESHVSIHPFIDPTTVTDETCQSSAPYTYLGFSDIDVSTPGVYTIDSVFKSTVTGCDSMSTLTLTVHPVLETEESAIVCANSFPYIWRDTTFLTGTVTGDYVFNRHTVNGCDSIVTLHLTVNPSYSQTENLTICQNELPYTWRDTTFQTGTVTGDYVFNRHTVNGCDSIVTLHLTVNPSYDQTENLTICQNELPYDWRDTTFQTGTVTDDYVFNRHTVNGCDSIVTLHLTVNPCTKPLVIESNDCELTYNGTEQKCESYTVTYDGTDVPECTTCGAGPDEHKYVVTPSDTITITDPATRRDVTDSVPNTFTVDIPEPEHFSDIDTVIGKIVVDPLVLVITTDDSTKAYDGTPLTDHGWLDTPPTGLATGDTVVYVDIYGTITEPGDSLNLTHQIAIVVRTTDPTDTVTGNYTITYVEGTLTVTPSTKPLVIKSNDCELTYNGTEQTCEDYTVTYGGEEIPECTTCDAGTGEHKYVITPGDTITITDPATRRDVTDSVPNTFTVDIPNPEHFSDIDTVIGKIEVDPLAITIIAASDEKEYDGTPLTKDAWTLDPSTPLAAGDAIDTVTVTGSITDPGNTPNVASDAVIAKGTEEVTGNYVITYVPGTLTVTPSTKPLVIKSNDCELTYNGTEQTCQDYTVTYGGEEIPECTTCDAGTDEHKYVITPGDTITITDPATRRDVTDSVPNTFTVDIPNPEHFSDIDTVIGKIEVDPLAITIIAASDEKEYDGTPLTKDAWTLDPSTPLAAGDAIDTVTVTGSITDPGNTPNVASDAVIAKGTEEVTGNYVITYVPGTLTVTPSTKPLVIKSNDCELTYNGTEQTCEDYTVTYGGEEIPECTTCGAGTGEHKYVVTPGDTITITDPATRRDVTDSVPNTFTVDIPNPEHFSDIDTVIGKIEVDPLAITIIAASDEKEYDGTPLTKDAWTLDPSTPLAAGDAIDTVTVTGSITDPGNTPNVASDAVIAKGTEEVTGNYVITYVPGTLTVYPALEITETSIMAVTCHDDKDGSVSISVAGGKKLSPKAYAYTVTGPDSYLTSGTTDSPLTLSDLAAGTYAATFTDALDSTISTSFTITEPEELVVSIVVPTNAADLCPNQGTYTVSLTTAGGNGGNTYVWSGDATDADAVSTTVTQTGTNDCSHEYSVSVNVTDSKGCKANDTKKFTVIDDIAPVIGGDNLDRELTSTNCEFTIPDLTGEVLAITTDNCSDATHLIATQDVPAGTIITPGSSKTVVVTVTDDCGNSNAKSITITTPNPLAATVEPAATTICYYDDAVLKALVKGGRPGYSYVWSTLETTSSITVAPTATTTYTVTVTDQNGCTATASSTVTVKPAALGMDDLSDYIRCNGAAFSVTPTGTTIPAGTQYVWTVAANANVTGQSAQTTPVDAPISQMLTNTSATKQTIVYTVTPMTDGCAGDAFTVTVEVEPTPELTLNCPADITKTLEFGSCALLLNPADLGTPSWAHSLGWSLVSITNDAPADNMYPEGDNVITWTMTDECGNTTTCEQHVIVIFPQCPDAVDYEGNVYHGVRIDCDCWTQRNLESHQYSDGSDIPGIYSYISDMYPDSAANAGTFGLLYDWESAIKDGQDNGYGHVQGICPEGWYLPTAEKYEALNLHGAAALKSPLYWLDGGGNNSTGFTSLPAGYYDGSIGRYLNLMGEAYYWSTTKVSGSWHSSASVIKHLCEEVSETDIREGLGYSVRCIKEKE